MSGKSASRKVIPIPIVGLKSGFDSMELSKAIADLSIGEKMQVAHSLQAMSLQVSSSAERAMHRIALNQPSN